jgi:hypothetical protein
MKQNYALNNKTDFLFSRSTLSIINKNVCIQTAVIKQISRSSSESGISSSSSNDDRFFETLV